MKLVYVPVAICVCMYVYLHTARANPLRPILDVTEAESHQAADVEVTEMHQCEWEHKGVLKECQYLVSYWHAWQGIEMGVMSSWQY